jgi:hypothetical protein
MSQPELLLPQSDQPSVLDRNIARQLVSVALAGLPEAQLDAITQAYFDGWTCEEIAAHTKTPVGTVKTRLRSGLKTMKRVLSQPAFHASLKRAELPATLESILITDQLFSRACRPRAAQQETDALRALARASSAEELIDCFLAMALELCGAGTAGVSLLETNTKGEQIFRWTNLAGKLAKYVGGSTPRNFSPCGVTLDCNAPQLFDCPGRYFSYFNEVDIPIVEGLVIPFHVGGKTEGTIWIVSHERGWAFDAEDVRVMISLNEFVGCALHVGRELPHE